MENDKYRLLIKIFLYYTSYFCSMTFHTHICTVGFYSAPSIAVKNSHIPIDKIILLNNDSDERSNKAEKEIRESFSLVGDPEIETKRIDPYDYHEIFDEVISIGKREKSLHEDLMLHINFTSGTNIMAGAMCSAAQYLECKLYYVMNSKDHPEMSRDELIREISPPNMFDVEKLKGLVKKTFIHISDSRPISNSNLQKKLGLTPSGLGYYTKLLSNYELIKKIPQGRNVCWELTDRGLSAIRQLPIESARSRSDIRNRKAIKPYNQQKIRSGQKHNSDYSSDMHVARLRLPYATH